MTNKEERESEEKLHEFLRYIFREEGEEELEEFLGEVLHSTQYNTPEMELINTIKEEIENDK